MTINPETLCGCRHTKENHIWKEVYSVALEASIYAEVCSAVPKCHCHHFQATTFVPESRRFVKGVVEKGKPAEQMEMFPGLAELVEVE